MLNPGGVEVLERLQPEDEPASWSCFPLSAIHFHAMAAGEEVEE